MTYFILENCIDENFLRMKFHFTFPTIDPKPADKFAMLQIYWSKTGCKENEWSLKRKTQY